MSIVISVIEKNRKLYIASDKRGIKKGVARDDYQKIHRLSEDLYFGMTGIYEAGLEFFNFIKEYATNDKYRLISNISKSFDSFFRTDKPEKLAIIVAGRCDSRNFFIWTKNIQGETEFIKGSTEKFGIVVSANDKIEIFRRQLLEELIRSELNVKDAIIKTIEYASEIDSTISKEHDLYEII